MNPSTWVINIVIWTIGWVSVTVGQQKPCIVKGHLFTTLPWYGYIAQKTFQTRSAKVRYQFSFPIHAAPKILIYHDDEIRKLKEDMTCEEREQILPVDNYQIIPLLPNKTAGCFVQSDSNGPIVICTGERDFTSSGPKTWYFVVSRCKDNRLLSFWYYFNITGYYGDCEADPLSNTYVPPPRFDEHQYVQVIIALGVIFGLVLVTLLVFVALWCRQRRTGHKKDKSNDSLTSSQATMTQDIFFVNSSMPQERDTSDYSRSSSENYYEVIPEGQNYDHMNSDRLVPGRLHHRGPYASRSVIPYHRGNQIIYHHNPSAHSTLPSRSYCISHSSHSDTSKSLHRTNPRNPNYPTPEDYPPPPYPMQTLIRGSYPRHPRSLTLHTDQHFQHQSLLPSIPMSPEASPQPHTHMLPLAETLA